VIGRLSVKRVVAVLRWWAWADRACDGDRTVGCDHDSTTPQTATAPQTATTPQTATVPQTATTPQTATVPQTATRASAATRSPHPNHNSTAPRPHQHRTATAPHQHRTATAPHQHRTATAPHQHRTSASPASRHSPHRPWLLPRARCSRAPAVEIWICCRHTWIRICCRHSLDLLSSQVTGHEPPDDSPESGADAICRRQESSSVRATARTCSQSGSPAVGEGWGVLRPPDSRPGRQQAGRPPVAA
jgi:hypothetical protein